MEPISEVDRWLKCKLIKLYHNIHFLSGMCNSYPRIIRVSPPPPPPMLFSHHPNPIFRERIIHTILGIISNHRFLQTRTPFPGFIGEIFPVQTPQKCPLSFENRNTHAAPFAFEWGGGPGNQGWVSICFRVEAMGLYLSIKLQKKPLP